jgi:hypothetical protein
MAALFSGKVTLVSVNFTDGPAVVLSNAYMQLILLTYEILGTIFARGKRAVTGLG